MQLPRTLGKAMGWAFLLLAAPALLAAGAKTVIPAGTHLNVVLTATLSSSVNQQGDPFAARIEDPIFQGGEEVIPAGSTLNGHVAFVKLSGRVKGKGEMRLVADSIVTPAGKVFATTADVTNSDSSQVKVKGNEGTIEGQGKSTKQTAKDAGKGAAIGAGVGVLSAGGTGALYGAGIGAAVGLISQLVKHHKGVVLPVGTNLTFLLTSPATETKGKPSPNGAPTFICPTCN